MLGSLDRAEIIRLLESFLQMYDAGDDYSAVVEQLERETQCPDLEQYLRWELCHNLRSVEHIAQRLALYQPTKPQLDRQALLELVQRIMACDGSEAEMDEAVCTFMANCRHPGSSNLIFWPDQVAEFANNPEPTAEEIVDLAMRGTTSN